jgi:ribosomal protein S18 acetylase RimI-like enzyme
LGSTWPPESANPVRIKHLGAGDDELVIAAEHLFDSPARSDAVIRFLGDSNHHLFIAYLDDAPVGFVSGVEVTHPDKGTEMFLYELAVDEGHQRQGIGTELVQALGELARSQGCYGMWVLADDDNAAAGATYRKAGGEVESQPVMFSWRFDPQP